MRFPECAIVEFATREDMFELATMCREVGDGDWADRLKTREFYNGLCARISDHRFVSFGSHHLYESGFWASFVSTVEPELLYCTVQELKSYMEFETEEDDIVPVDLSDIL